MLPEGHVWRVLLGQSHLELGGADIKSDNPGGVRGQEDRTLA